MPGDVSGLFLTISLILICWLLSFVIKRIQIFGNYSEEIARKAVHIGVSNFAFIYLSLFEGNLIPILGLFSFALINLFTEIHFGTKRSWGTVMYPAVIAVLIIINSFAGNEKMTVAVSLLGMGYGDGLAAIVGKALGKHRLPGSKDKTWEGSIVCFAVISAIMILMAGDSVSKALLIGLSATLAEAYTPWGLDNISVPVVIYILEDFLCF